MLETLVVVVVVDGGRLDDGGMSPGGALDELHLGVEVLVQHVLILLPCLACKVLVLLGNVIRAELVIVGDLTLFRFTIVRTNAGGSGTSAMTLMRMKGGNSNDWRGSTSTARTVKPRSGSTYVSSS